MWCVPLLHFASSLPVLLAYSTVATLAIGELSIRGREVCTHTPSQKTALVSNQRSHAKHRYDRRKTRNYLGGRRRGRSYFGGLHALKLVEMDLDLASDLMTLFRKAPNGRVGAPNVALGTEVNQSGFCGNEGLRGDLRHMQSGTVRLPIVSNKVL